MNLHIKQIMDHSIHLFRDKLESSGVSKNKVVIVALIALGCLAACLYYALCMKTQPSKIDHKITPQPKQPFGQKIEINKSEDKTEGTAEDKGAVEDEILEAKPKPVDPVDDEGNDDKNEPPLLKRYQFDPSVLVINDAGKSELINFVETYMGGKRKTIRCDIPNYSDKATVEDFLAIVAKEAHVPIASIRLVFCGKMINTPDNLKRLISEYELHKEGPVHLVLRTEKDTEQLNRVIESVAAETDAIYFNIEYLETIILSLNDRIRRGKLDNIDTQFADINDFISKVEKKIPKDDKGSLDCLIQLRSVLTSAEKLFKEGIDVIASTQKTEFKQMLEDLLESYPSVSCQPDKLKPTFLLIHPTTKKSIVFDKDALQSQLGNGPMGDLFNDQGTKGIELKIQEELFDILSNYLTSGDASDLESLDEKSLIDLYKTANGLIIPRLELQCALEIAHRLIKSEWKQQELLRPYLEKDTTWLGKMLKVYNAH